ncbi:MAG TPA: hypothetical protein VFF73_24585, partial [Planctomycetota bacterium]|nr:hypothetical protein [Planctomycetota bacterium]
APAQTWQDVHDAVRNGFTSLLGSDRANEVLDDHLEPAITLVASMNVGDLSAVHVSKADLEAAMKTAPVAPAATASILTRMVTVLSNLTANVGNAPGPSTTLTALVAIAAPMFVARKLNARSDAMTFAGKLYRYLIKVADLSPQQFNTVAQAAEEAISADQSATLAILRTKIDWTTRFHNSATWGMALGIANLFCFCAAVTDTESDTLRRWSNIMSSGTGTALGFSVAAGRFSALIEQGIVKGVGGKILGVVGGVAVIMQGAASIRDAEDVDDKLGIGFGVASVAGGVLSVAGFLCAAGIAADATIVGAPAGTVLMACGAILGAGAAAGDAIRSSFIASTQDIFQHYLKDEFDRDGGPFRQVCPSDSTGGERSAFKDCMDHDHWSFYPVHPDQAAALWDVGFANADAIVKMCDANEAEEKVIRFNLLSRIQGH